MQVDIFKCNKDENAHKYAVRGEQIERGKKIMRESEREKIERKRVKERRIYI